MTERNRTIDKLRGICMLGVLGIHTGSLALMCAAPNPHLYMLLEILSRYSVPAFFFISGYGLFCHYKPGAELNYREFIKKRFQSSGIPYLSWSLFYMVYFTTVVPGCIPWFSPLGLLHILFWGLACYHLYFMIILLWFYAFFPLFQKLMAFMQRIGLKTGFAVLFVLQMLFNYWTMHPGITAQQLPLVLQDFFTYRLNYLPLHYLFIFMLGGLAAIKEKEFFQALTDKYITINLYFGLKNFHKSLGIFINRFAIIIALYLLSIAYICGSYYYYYYEHGYDLISLTNTFQQLSPQGFFYTIASILFFCAVFGRQKTTNYFTKAVDFISDNSMLVYFCHPFWLSMIDRTSHHFDIVMTTKRVIAAYFLLLIISLITSIILTNLSKHSASLRYLLTGKK